MENLFPRIGYDTITRDGHDMTFSYSCWQILTQLINGLTWHNTTNNCTIFLLEYFNMFTRLWQEY